MIAIDNNVVMTVYLPFHGVWDSTDKGMENLYFLFLISRKTKDMNGLDNGDCTWQKYSQRI